MESKWIEDMSKMIGLNDRSYDDRSYATTFPYAPQDGAPKIAKLPYKWLWFMVDITIVNGGYNGL